MNFVIRQVIILLLMLYFSVRPRNLRKKSQNAAEIFVFRSLPFKYICHQQNILFHLPITHMCPVSDFYTKLYFRYCCKLVLTTWKQMEDKRAILISDTKLTS